MSPYSRSAKVLLYLVASMTVATGLLLWMEYLVAPPGVRQPARPTNAAVTEALHTREPVQPGNWDEIVVSYRDRVASDPMVALAATGRPSPHHLVVEPTGRIHSLSAWKDQQANKSGGEAASRTIRVCLAGRPDAEAISAEQWDTLVSLLRQLRLRCQLPTKSVRLDPQSDPQFRPNISPQAHRLHQMLLAARIID